MENTIKTITNDLIALGAEVEETDEEAQAAFERVLDAWDEFVDAVKTTVETNS
jgi:hypothetical protein